MLSRIANNLYWAGRYLERMEHISRYVPVTYFSALDGPDQVNEQYALRSINEMTGSLSSIDILKEREVLFNVAFDRNNPSSLLSCATLVRENCRGARDILSTELWESINRLYLFCMQYNQESYLTTGMQQFMITLQDRIALCKARIQTTLIQNQVWSILTLGLLLERSDQIVRICQIKMKSIKALKLPDNFALETYEIANLLKSLESYDMNRKYFKKAVDMSTAFEFLFLNAEFPRSLKYCVGHSCSHLKKLGIDQKGKNKSVKLLAEKFNNELSYMSVEDILSDIDGTLENFRNNLAVLNNNLIQNYFAN